MIHYYKIIVNKIVKEMIIIGINFTVQKYYIVVGVK